MPLGQVPVLKVDGEMFCQMNAIVNYAANLALPKLSALEQFRSDMVCETLKEVGQLMVAPAMAAIRGILETGRRHRC